MAMERPAPASSSSSRERSEGDDHGFDKVAVVGLGYIGLPTAAIFAGRKVKVVGIDVDRKTVATINRGEIHIKEPELDILVRAVVANQFLRATDAPEPADAFLIAVPTPFRNGADGAARDPDLSFVQAASASIAPVLKPGDIVVLESTSPVGTTEKMAGWLADARPDLTFPQDAGEASDIRIAHCPERVLPGRVLREFVQNDRLIGGMTPRCSAMAAKLYGLVVEGECIVTTPRTAELAKLTENSFRDLNIAFANELSMICDELGVDVWELINLANRHPRVNVLQPGAGVGGHCIAVDPWFIVSSAPGSSRLIRTAREINDAKPGWVLMKIESAIAATVDAGLRGRASDVTVACYGLSFKPDIDDLRESPAVHIARELCDRHPGRVLAVEPHIDALPPSLNRAQKCDLQTAIETADIHVILVSHSEFRALDRRMWPGATIDVAGPFRS